MVYDDSISKLTDDDRAFENEEKRFEERQNIHLYLEIFSNDSVNKKKKKGNWARIASIPENGNFCESSTTYQKNSVTEIVQYT